jgi:hypothetical protein
MDVETVGTDMTIAAGVIEMVCVPPEIVNCCDTHPLGREDTAGLGQTFRVQNDGLG